MRGFGYGYDEDERDWYDVQQVCLNGHVITNYAESKPDGCRARCSICGTETITKCPSCSVNIRGYHHVPGVFYPSANTPENFCDSCGAAMPWVEQKISGILDIVVFSDMVAEDEVDSVKESIKSLIVSSGQTELAALRLRRIMEKMVDYERDSLLRALKAVASTEAKIALGLSDTVTPPRKRR